jgi:hypothetical protein
MIISPLGLFNVLTSPPDIGSVLPANGTFKNLKAESLDSGSQMLAVAADIVATDAVTTKLVTPSTISDFWQSPTITLGGIAPYGAKFDNIDANTVSGAMIADPATDFVSGSAATNKVLTPASLEASLASPFVIGSTTRASGYFDELGFNTLAAANIAQQTDVSAGTSDTLVVTAKTLADQLASPVPIGTVAPNDGTFVNLNATVFYGAIGSDTIYNNAYFDTINAKNISGTVIPADMTELANASNTQVVTPYLLVQAFSTPPTTIGDGTTNANFSEISFTTVAGNGIASSVDINAGVDNSKVLTPQNFVDYINNHPNDIGLSNPASGQFTTLTATTSISGVLGSDGTKQNATVAVLKADSIDPSSGILATTSDIANATPALLVDAATLSAELAAPVPIGVGAQNSGWFTDLVATSISGTVVADQATVNLGQANDMVVTPQTLIGLFNAPVQFGTDSSKSDIYGATIYGDTFVGPLGTADLKNIATVSDLTADTIAGGVVADPAVDFGFSAVNNKVVTPSALQLYLSSPQPIGDTAQNTISGTIVTATDHFIGQVGAADSSNAAYLTSITADSITGDVLATYDTVTADWPNTGVPLTSAVFKFGTRSLDFSAASPSYVKIPGVQASVNISAWTLEFWLQVVEPVAADTPILRSADGTIALTLNTSSNLQVLLSTSDATLGDIMDGTDIAVTLSTADFTHIAVEFDGTDTYTVYVNGAQVRQVTSANFVNAAAWDTLTLTNNNVGSLGYIDEFRISNVERYTGNSITVPDASFANDPNTAAYNNFEGPPTDRILAADVAAELFARPPLIGNTTANGAYFTDVHVSGTIYGAIGSDDSNGNGIFNNVRGATVDGNMIADPTTDFLALPVPNNRIVTPYFFDYWAKNPGTIGETTPNAIYGTTVTASTLFVGPIGDNTNKFAGVLSDITADTIAGPVVATIDNYLGGPPQDNAVVTPAFLVDFMGQPPVLGGTTPNDATFKSLTADSLVGTAIATDADVAATDGTTDAKVLTYGTLKTFIQAPSVAVGNATTDATFGNVTLTSVAGDGIATGTDYDNFQSDPATYPVPTDKLVTPDFLNYVLSKPVAIGSVTENDAKFKSCVATTAFYGDVGDATTQHAGYFTNLDTNTITTTDLNITGTFTLDSQVTPAQGGTGLSNFTKGDLIAASSPTVLNKVAVGADYTQLYALSSEPTSMRWGVLLPENYLQNGNPVYQTPKQYIMPYVYARNAANTDNIIISSSRVLDLNVVGALNGIAQGVELGGTVDSTGTTVTGNGSSFGTDFIVGDVIFANGEGRRVVAIAGETITVESRFTTDLAGATYQNGGLAPRTHYYIYACGHTTTPGYVLSTRSRKTGDTLINLPTGYSTDNVRQLLHTITTDTASNVVFAIYNNNFVNILSPQATSTVGSTSYVPVSTGYSVPKTANAAMVSLHLRNSSGATNSVTLSNSLAGTFNTVHLNVAANGEFFNTVPATLSSSDKTLYALVQRNANGSNVDVTVQGYWVNAM